MRAEAPLASLISGTTINANDSNSFVSEVAEPVQTPDSAIKPGILAALMGEPRPEGTRATAERELVAA